MTTGEFTARTRSQWEDAFKRSVRLRNPTAATGDGEYYSVQAKTLADQLVIVSGYAKTIAGKISLQDRTGSQLDEAGRPISEGGLGVARPAAVGASGSVVVQATASGTTLLTTHELETEDGITYRVTTGGNFSDGDRVPVLCTEQGPHTNLDPGTKLTWRNPPAGCFSQALVYEQPDGTGLTGGREALGDDEYRAMLAQAQANPAASANDSELQRYIMDSRGHGIAVEQAFTYPAFLGPGLTGYTFTLRGTSTLGSRIPNSTQINTVSAYVNSKLPLTDDLVSIAPVAEDMALSFRVKWAANGWADRSVWPEYYPAATRWVIAPGNWTPTLFGVTTTQGLAPLQPYANMSIGVFNPGTGKFVRKTIASVTGGSPPYLLAAITEADASDLSYAPVSGQWIVPWSDALNDIAALAVAHSNSMGPGEVTEHPTGDGRRMMRSPAPGALSFPSEMDGRLSAQVNELPSVQRATPVDGADFSTTLGNASYVYLAKLSDLGVFPL